MVLEQPAGGKQPAGSILYFQLHNLHLAQTSGLAEYRPPGKKPPLANIGQVARIGQLMREGMSAEMSTGSVRMSAFETPEGLPPIDDNDLDLLARALADAPRVRATS